MKSGTRADKKRPEALTKLPASPTDSEAGVKQKVLAWLEAHPDMLDRDQIVLGGG